MVKAARFTIFTARMRMPTHDMALHELYLVKLKSDDGDASL